MTDIYKVDEFKDGMPEDEMKYLADRIGKYSSDWGKTIVFVKTRRHAMQLGMLLYYEKIPCFVYISDKTFEYPHYKIQILQILPYFSLT